MIELHFVSVHIKTFTVLQSVEFFEGLNESHFHIFCNICQQIQVKSNTLAIDDLQNEVNSLKAQLQSVQSDVQGLTSRVTTLESDTGSNTDLEDQV